MGDCLEKKAREAADELNEFRKKSPEYKLYTVGGWGCDAAASAADSAVVPGAGAVFAGVVRTGEKAVGKAIGKKVMREAEESVIEHADEAAARRLLHEAEERAKKEAKKAAERAEREAAERAAKEAEALARRQVQPAQGSPGSYTPDRALPTDKRGVPIPDSPDPHSQLGRSKPKYGSEPQAREWQHGSNGSLQPQRDIDFTDHGTPSIHPKPHQHRLTPNNPELAPQGGFRRGPPESL